MKKSSLFLLVLIFSIKSQAQVDSSYKYSSNGVFYKVIKDGAGTKANYGSYIQFTMEQFYNDSVVNDTKNGKQILLIDSSQVPIYYFAALRNANVGDSIIYRLATDSVRQMYAPYPWVKPGSFFNSYFKIEKVFSSKAEADIAIKKLKEENFLKDSLASVAEMGLESAVITKYLASKNIKYVRSPKGTFINITKAGNGKKITARSVVMVNYLGKILEGKIFDSNTDSVFKHVKPYEVDMVKGKVIQGWLDGLTYFSEGTKGTLYIPSPLGWGKVGAGPDIGPNSIVVFDIEVLSIKDPVIAAPVIKKTTPAIKTTTKSIAVKIP